MANDPVMIAYAVRQTRSGKGSWTEIGRAYPHAEGSGLTVVLDVVPRDGRVVLLEPGESEARREARLRELQCARTV